MVALGPHQLMQPVAWTEVAAAIAPTHPLDRIPLSRSILMERRDLSLLTLHPAIKPGGDAHQQIALVIALLEDMRLARIDHHL